MNNSSNNNNNIVGLYVMQILIIFIFIVNPTSATPLTVAFPKVPKSLNFLNGESPVEQFVRNATSTGLFGFDQEEVTTSDISYVDSYSTDSEGRVWNLMLKPNLKFSNGQKIIDPDITNSLINCSHLGLKSAKFLGFNNLEIVFNYSSATNAQKLTALALCPIYSSFAQTAFQRDFAKNTNYIGCGYYKITSLTLGKKIILSRNIFQSAEVELPEYITIIPFKNADDGLSKLRAGRYDAVFTRLKNINKKALTDSTLEVLNCYGVYLLKRKTFNIQCSNRNLINFSSLKYIEK